MKHLKRFNESKLDQSIIDECKDILLELEDIGIKTRISSHFNTGISVVKNDEDRYNTISFVKKQVVDVTSNTYNKNWITFFFSRKEEFDYSDIEDVVERLKSYLSECGLKISWMSPTERKEKRPTIQTTRVMNPMTFTPEGVKTQCELHFN